MNKEGINYISDCIHNMVCDENVLRVLKQNSVLHISDQDISRINVVGDIRIFYYEFSGTEMIEAYFPFFNIIAKLIETNHLDLDQLMESAGIYSLQRCIFSSYIRTGRAIREDEPIVTECEFEQDKIITGIISLLEQLSEKKPIFILLNKVNRICDSTLDILKRLVDLSNYNINILIITNEMGTIKQYIREKYNAFIKKCTTKGIVSDWPFEEKEDVVETDNTYIFRNDTEDLEKIKTMLYTFALEQANYYISMIYQKVELDRATVTSSFRLEMLTLYIVISIYKKNNSYALILCERLKNIETTELIDRKNYTYYFLKTNANMYLGNDTEANKDAKKCKEIAYQMDDEYALFMALLLENMADLSGWNNIWICDKEIHVSEELIQYCYKYNYMNHLSHIYVYCFDNDYKLYTVIEGIEERTKYVTKGIYIASKLGNDRFLIEAYRKNVMIASCNGLFDTANYFYQKSIEVSKRTNNKFEEANIYNGLGYNCCTADRYSDANRYYNNALEIFVSQQSDDFILETLYNMGMNAILAGDYAHASEYLSTVNNILTILKKNSLRVCNVSKIFGLIALASFKQGNLYTAQLFINKSENYLSYILGYDKKEFYNYLWDDDLFLYFYVSALVFEKNGKLQESLENFEKAKEFMERCVGSKFFNYVFYAADKSILLKKMGREQEAQSLLCEARNYFNSKGNYLRVRMFDELISTGRWENQYSKMTLKRVTIDEIMKLIRIKSIESKAKSRRQKIRFFGTFQELISHPYEDVDQLLCTLVTNFKSNFSLENLILISCESTEPTVRYSDLDYEISQDDVKTIIKYFENNTTGFALSKFSNNYKDFEGILSIFKYSKIFSIIGAPIYNCDKLQSIFITFVKIPESWNSVIDREVLDEEDLEVYQIVFRQILDAVEKYKLNERLKQQAVTDDLTGLLNRKGYYNKIDDIIMDTVKSEDTVSATMLYIDLDHFKYYNDTFGHHVGDALLIQFSKIFTKASGNQGTVVRFGGDEFVVILNTTDQNTIGKVCKSIYSLIKKEDGFINIVKKFIDIDTAIPEENRATCSIGISIQEKIVKASDFTIMQKQADAALYYAKKHGRGRAIFYNEDCTENKK